MRECELASPHKIVSKATLAADTDPLRSTPAKKLPGTSTEGSSIIDDVNQCQSLACKVSMRVGVDSLDATVLSSMLISTFLAVSSHDVVSAYPKPLAHALALPPALSYLLRC